MTTLWIDDDRPLPSFYDVAVTTVDEAVRWLSAARDRGERVDVVSFDYDAHRLFHMTFMPVAEWMRDHDYWPRELRIHTFNYWEGRPAYVEFFAAHAPADTVVDAVDPWLYTPYLVDRPALDPECAPEWVRAFIKEVVVHGETGFLVPVEQMTESPFEPLDPEQFSKDLAAGINELMANPALREKMGRAGRKRAEEKFSWSAIAQQTHAL